MDNYYFYVLLCSDASFYGGFSTDIKRRTNMHNAGKGAKYTRSRLPVKLIHFECFNSKSNALKAECRFKKLSRKQKEKYLLSFGVDYRTY